MAEQLKLDTNELQPTQSVQESPEVQQFVLGLTSNPWTDFGIVSLCKDLCDTSLIHELELTAHEAIIQINNVDIERVEEGLNQIFRDRWNKLFWLSRGAKILEIKNLIYDADGFIDNNLSKVKLTEADRARIKEKSPNSPVKDEEMSMIQRRFNFIGTKTDANRFRKKLETIVRDFIQNWKEPVGKVICEVSGQPSAKQTSLLQVLNPFANKHQNTKIRGFHGDNLNPKVASLYYLINLCTTLDAGVPFAYDPNKNSTLLILPDLPDLTSLARVYARLQENLRDDLPEKELYPYTNLRDRIQSYNRYSLVLSLFHNIYYEFTVPSESDDTEGGWDFVPLMEEPKKLIRWSVIPFARGQSVNFQNFHTVAVSDRLYDFIKPIHSKQREIKLVPDVLARIKPKPRSPDGENTLAQLSRAVATSSPSLLKVAVFNLWKHAGAINFDLRLREPHPVSLLQPFINYFLEVNQVLHTELREDLRALGTTIGRTFRKDITLISKLFNISSINAFRETLNLVMFRLYKFSTADKVNEAIAIKQERIDRILTQLTDENYKECAETLSTYASLSAYNENVFSEKSDSKGGQND